MPFDLTAENAKSTKMQTLHPIIRRKRRSLMIEVVPPLPTQTTPVQSVVIVPADEPAKKPKPDNAKSVSSSATP
jgi:hypothetical protein